MSQPSIKVKVMCLIVRNNAEVLVGLGHDNIKDEDFGRILGGHVEFGETAEAALRREFKEELDTKLENLRFLKITENIFTYNGEPGHEIVFLYTGDLVNKELYNKDQLKILDNANKAVWLKTSDIKSGKLKIYPEINL